jgi:hypothetical protein
VVTGSASEMAAPDHMQGQRHESSGGEPLPAACRGGGVRPISRPVRVGPLAFFLFFCFFYLINRGGHLDRLRKVTINRDLGLEAVAMSAFINPFCLPPLRFL